MHYLYIGTTRTSFTCIYMLPIYTYCPYFYYTYLLPYVFYLYMHAACICATIYVCKVFKKQNKTRIWVMTSLLTFLLMCLLSGLFDTCTLKISHSTIYMFALGLFHWRLNASMYDCSLFLFFCSLFPLGWTHLVYSQPVCFIWSPTWFFIFEQSGFNLVDKRLKHWLCCCCRL